MTEPSARPSRAEQRRQSEERILAAARRIFAELGYDRTTIRAVAAAAGVDGGLVMHYFGSKDLLFARASEIPADELPGGTADEVAEALLTSLGRRLTDEPTASLAVLRSMLTNADAADRYRAAGEPQLNQLTEAIPTPDADLRASLLSAIVHGVVAERYLLRLTHLADASPEQIVDLLRPCFQSLATPPAEKPQSLGP
ncbi:TetR/AcrR family transcriptional regulator [Amycolatopsis sp. WQ 127309]|uniref:TetR/AcrR family transcriptional regulator n=1 Tax=Amycolatopsis sp. WQ 127309 TaxID=2932773 RepID=UPI001FF2264F|nr:TetR/AcrR family transcriptional regulator [Amycolatopsis sp. WQ 127309]UOZ03984.1 TetR family transcriptional regulator [Amycolatopsis sp. WQ 127309]